MFKKFKNVIIITINFTNNICILTKYFIRFVTTSFKKVNKFIINELRSKMRIFSSLKIKKQLESLFFIVTKF